MTTIYTSNDGTIGFDATTAGTLPTDWANKVGTWQVGTVNLEHGHTHSFGATSEADGDVAIISGASSAADMDLVFDQKTVTTTPPTPTIGAIVRCDSTYQNCYTVVLDPGSSGGTGPRPAALLFARNSGTYALLAGVQIASTLTAAEITRIRFQALGTTVRVKVWNPSAIPEPTAWDNTVTDSSVSAAGFAGLYYTLNGASPLAMGVGDLVVSTLASNYLGVNTPATQATSTSFTLTGIYGGSAPTAVDVSFDGGTVWTALTSFSAATNTWSGDVTAPSVAGDYYALVRNHSTTTETNSSAWFSVSGSSETIGVDTPSTQTAGGTYTYTGTYTNGPPVALDYRFDSGPWNAAASPTIGGGTYRFDAIAPAAGSHTLGVRDHNNTAAAGTSGSFTTNPANISVAPNDAAFLYSPLNWHVTSGAATTINSGAYFKILFTGASCVLNFDDSHMASPKSQILWRIDGTEGVWTKAEIATSITLTIPASTDGNADIPYHLLEVIVKATTETANRWNNVGSATGTAVIFTGLTVDFGAVVVAQLAAPKTVLIYGDSITEGVRTVGESATDDTDRNDARMCWAYEQGRLLGAEVGVVGFGGSGLSVTGSGNVPILGTSYSLLYSGQARSFSTPPDLIAINIGTNDGSNNTVAAMTGVLNGIIAACPGKPIAVLRPFNGAQASNLQAAIAACNDPTVCTYIDTTGFFNTAYGADSLNLHPSGPNDIARIAPQIAEQLQPILYPTTGAGRTFHNGFWS